MGFIEWIGEAFNPGPVGTLRQAEEQGWEPKGRFLIWFFTLAGLALLGLILWAILSSNAAWKWVAGLVIYLIIAWFLSPNPESRNMGWFGGLMDNPFRISDDFNRLLLFLALLLLPGELILFSLQVLYNSFRSLLRSN